MEYVQILMDDYLQLLEERFEVCESRNWVGDAERAPIRAPARAGAPLGLDRPDPLPADKHSPRRESSLCYPFLPLTTILSSVALPPPAATPAV